MKQKEDTYPKYFRSAGLQQNGKIGKVTISNGIFIIENPEQFEWLKELGCWKRGEVYPVGKGLNVEVKDGGAIIKTVNNPFTALFSDEELVLINNIPNEVMLDTVKVNVLMIAKEYSNPYEDEETDNAGPVQEEEPKTEFPEPPAEVKMEIDDKRLNVKWLKEYLEVKGVLYPDKANKQELYELYLQN